MLSLSPDDLNILAQQRVYLINYINADGTRLPSPFTGACRWSTVMVRRPRNARYAFVRRSHRPPQYLLVDLFELAWSENFPTFEEHHICVFVSEDVALAAVALAGPGALYGAQT